MYLPVLECGVHGRNVGISHASIPSQDATHVEANPIMVMKLKLRFRDQHLDGHDLERYSYSQHMLLAHNVQVQVIGRSSSELLRHMNEAVIEDFGVIG